MFRFFEQQHQPIKIKSLKELEPGFKPRWFRISFRLILMGFLSMPVIVAGSVLKVSLLIWLGVAVFHFVMFALIALSVVPRGMRFVGYWWPWVGLKAAQLDSWLERDLDWGN
ncbi:MULTISPECIES: hypothetical protein [unclassified Leisingera]|uniref:hypothetical protein n=1 Tax=unclassified Leisingera TaxID=2614906 RepID=UPI0003613E11|nr:MULTISPECIES: hypothetical protein [unclassified Leisingera]KIC24798.1 hypothetical protein RA23_09665 [Leisingera sp. ANG-S3]KIC28420.1 hypothetical protein RA24_10900 [Leisingera sp. ANG-M6]KIC55346.1 hypothetical protein RA22_00945 [Leisingera sp. ANG-S]KID09078.1 hypothetical protein GC1_10330 [Leisingera sp. ANG1]